ncbi:MAG: hypothetical protein IMY87_01760 [Chloroflexi bacterium]|jgi:hypothetical protein|nr:hypothetical protein [Chloroflexota bacterium]
MSKPEREKRWAMKRHLVTIASVCFGAAILFTAVPVLSDCPDQVQSAPPQVTEQNGQIPSYLYPYYPYSDIQKQGVHQLTKLLEQYEWLYSHYQVHSFDCSEMSAFMERMLEVDGWNTYIACGLCPWNPDKRHAWLLVETSPDSYMPIEATVQTIVYDSDRYFDEYFKYDCLFKTIYDALEYKPTQFDWWDSL